MSALNRIIVIFGLFLLIASPAFAAKAIDGPLKIGVKLSEPWVMYDASQPEDKRQPRGFSIDLWQSIAQEMGKKTQWVYFNTVPELIKATSEKTIDAGISAITVTSEREDKVDFSNSMYELGLQIMVPADANPNPWLVAIGEIGNLFTWKVLLILLGLIIVFAHVRWLVDGDGGTEEATFAHEYPRGIMEAAWWALTMFITWDTPPRRGLARVVDLVWFLLGFLCLGILSSVITAALTEQNINGNISSVKDLLDKKVAAVATDAPREYLQKLGINVVPVKDLAEGLQKVTSKEVSALVHDGPRLVYMANQFNRKAEPKDQVVVLPAIFNPQTYGIVFPTNSPLVEPANHALMKLREAQGLEDSVHEELRKKWLAEE